MYMSWHIENGLLFVPKGHAQNAQAQMFSDPNMAMDIYDEEKPFNDYTPGIASYIVFPLLIRHCCNCLNFVTFTYWYNCLN
jgi:hypothetical protein